MKCENCGKAIDNEDIVYKYKVNQETILLFCCYDCYDYYKSLIDVY